MQHTNREKKSDVDQDRPLVSVSKFVHDVYFLDRGASVVALLQYCEDRGIKEKSRCLFLSTTPTPTRLQPSIDTRRHPR